MTLKEKTFHSWFEKLGDAWVQRNPQAVPPLLAEKFEYFETPFDKPYTQKKDILSLWQEVPNSQKDILFDFEILVVHKDTAIAHWTVRFTQIKTGKKAHLDGIFLVKLNPNGLCTLFKMWYNSK